MPSEPGWWDSLLRIKVHVQLVVASIEVTFEHAPSAPSPYRLDNRTGLQMACVQKGADLQHAVGDLDRLKAIGKQFPPPPPPPSIRET